LGALLAVTLAACDTAEERAEKHYQSGLELLAAGDVDRARVEFQTVFKYNGLHRGARAALARLFFDNGAIAEAYASYLRLIEQYPDDVDGRLMLAEIAISQDSWDIVEPHLEKLQEIAPDNPRTRVLDMALNYRDAILADDPDTRRAIAADAVALIADVPDSVINRTIVADNHILEGESDAALAQLDALQELAPDDRRFYAMRLGVMSRTEDMDGFESVLLTMFEKFPEDELIGDSLMRFYRSRDDLEGAEAFLRSRITPGEKDDDARISLVRFINQTKGIDAAIQEAEAFIDEGTSDAVFTALLATLTFDTGETDTAIALLEGVLSDAAPSEVTRDIQVALAAILDRTDNRVGARALIETVLEQDPGLVQALKMKADWLTDEDQTEEAIQLLRRALDQEPNNAPVLTSMAEAHLRNGRRELASEMLALAVQASNSAASESLDYARFLFDGRRFKAAEGVLVDALRVDPENTGLLVELGTVYIRMEEWARAEQVEVSLRQLDTEEGTALADRLKLSILRAQERDSEAIEFLETLSAQQGNEFAADIAILRTHLQNNDVVGARAKIEELLEIIPDDPALRFLSAALRASTGDINGAEAEYRAMIEAGTTIERVYMELARVLAATQRRDEAYNVIDAGLQSNPTSGDLLWMRATLYEQDGDYEGAIAVYEQLYEINSTISVVANNLASLLSTVRTDPESLDRAWRIARRLRDTDFAPFQDTYGWIAYLRGDYAEALDHLEPAAAALSNTPLVVAHYGLALAAMDRREEAITQLDRALQMAGNDTRRAFAMARDRLDELRAGDNPETTAVD